MLSIYIGAFGFGALFILTSIIFGGNESDFDKDIDVDMDGDIDVDIDVDVDADVEVDIGGDFDKDIELQGDASGLDMEAWLPFLSLRFWTFAFFSFGMSGTLLTFLAGNDGTGETITLIISLILGLSLGYGISWTFQKLKRDSVTASTETKSFEQQEGVVQLAIRPQGQGKVRLRIDNQVVDIRAITQDSEEIPIGSKVIIVSVKDGVANVTRLGKPSTSAAQASRRTDTNTQLQ